MHEQTNFQAALPNLSKVTFILRDTTWETIEVDASVTVSLGSTVNIDNVVTQINAESNLVAKYEMISYLIYSLEKIDMGNDEITNVNNRNKIIAILQTDSSAIDASSTSSSDKMIVE